MQELGTVLKNTLRKNGVEHTLRQKKILFHWEEIVGKTIAKNCKAHQIHNNQLILKASTPVWRNEIVLKKDELIIKTNKFLGKNIIKNIRVI